MKARIQVFLLWSVAFHIALAVLFSLKDLTKSEESVPIAIDYLPVADSKPSINTPRAPKSPSAPRSLTQFLPKALHSGGIKHSKVPNDSYSQISRTEPGDSVYDIDGSVAPFASPIQSLTDAVELDPFYHALWSRLAALAHYPEDFSKHYISGSVTIRMEVDFRGVMTQRKLVVESDNPYLEVLTLYTVIRALKEPLPARYWISKTKVPVSIRLNFIQRLPTDPRQQSMGSIVGHHLEISKFDYLPPEAMKKLDDFMLTYVPPVIPIPGGFYVDFVRAYQMIQRIQEPDENEMRSFRVEALQESLNRLLEKELEQSKDAG